LDMLQSKLKYEKSRFLPEDVARIIMHSALHMVTVRYRTYCQTEKEHNFTTLNGKNLVTTQLHATQISSQEFTHRDIR
jgi:hypothetical protein